jgi:putative transposase
MSGTVSSGATRPYGVKLVCRTWEQPRSSYYVSKRGAELPVRLAPTGKRGPKTVLSDTELLELIRADLKASPFQGEGHRKVWARLRVRDGVKVGRRRVLRLMREHNLLSPYRGRRGTPRLHEGRIITRWEARSGALSGALPAMILKAGSFPKVAASLLSS